MVLVPAFPMDAAFGIYARLRELNHGWRVPFYEGIVMKRTDSAYPIHTRSATEEFPGWTKHRFLN